MRTVNVLFAVLCLGLTGNAAAEDFTARNIVRHLSAQPTANVPVMLEVPLQFDYNSAAITPLNALHLDQLAAALNDPTLIGQSFLIEGHTDVTGSPPANLALSQKRANAVRDYLYLRQVAPARLNASGYGDTRLLPGLPPTDARHRRVIVRREY